MGGEGQYDKGKQPRTLALFLCQSFLILDLTFTRISELANPRLGKIKIMLDTSCCDQN